MEADTLVGTLDPNVIHGYKAFIFGNLLVSNGENKALMVQGALLRLPPNHITDRQILNV